MHNVERLRKPNNYDTLWEQIFKCAYEGQPMIAKGKTVNRNKTENGNCTKTREQTITTLFVL